MTKRTSRAKKAQNQGEPNHINAAEGTADETVDVNRRGAMVDSDASHQAGTDLYDGSERDAQNGVRYDARIGDGEDVQEGARMGGYSSTETPPRNSGTGETDARTTQRSSKKRSATNVGDEGFSDSVTPASGSGAIRVDYEGDFASASTEETQADHFQKERNAQAQKGGFLGMTSTNDTRTVAAVFRNWDDATRAVNKLEDAGFNEDQIGIARLDDKHGSVQRVNTAGKAKDAGDDVAGGIVAGAAVGGVTGLLAALASLAIPGVGPIIAGGVLATTFGTAAGTAIAGAGVGAGIGAAAGGLIGALTSLGLSEDEARAYEGDLRSGGTLVTVRAVYGRADEAIRMLQQMGGETRSRLGGNSADPNWRFG